MFFVHTIDIKIHVYSMDILSRALLLSLFCNDVVDRLTAATQTPVG